MREESDLDSYDPVAESAVEPQITLDVPTAGSV